MANVHPFDEAASEIANWIKDESAWYADALRGGYNAPFAAPVSEQEKLDYYRRQVFMTNPDGTPNYEQPNTQGREMLMKRLGIPGYTRVMAAALPRGREVEQDSEELPEAPEGESY